MKKMNRELEMQKKLDDVDAMTDEELSQVKIEPDKVREIIKGQIKEMKMMIRLFIYTKIVSKDANGETYHDDTNSIARELEIPVCLVKMVYDEIENKFSEQAGKLTTAADDDEDDEDEDEE